MRIALTPGEPAGIGPDLCIALAQQGHSDQLVVIADPELLAQRARALNLPLTLIPWTPERLITEPALQVSETGILAKDNRAEVAGATTETVLADSALPHARSQASGTPPGHLYLVEGTRLQTPAVAGRLDETNATYVLKTLAQACDGCLRGDFDALVTAPVHKGVINDAGLPFSGHTEFFAERCQAQPVMLLTTPGLRVALATTHLPLRAVPEAITQTRLEGVIQVLHRDLQGRFGIRQPRILVCGLNPHAGEGGHLGDEEQRVIQPVLERLRRDAGMDLRGPLPADTAFLPPRLAEADAVLAMYHDQGLPVLKQMGFGNAVNVTLGLPIIRTSVDHGTALELAGTGKADAGSLMAALRLAIELAGNTRLHSLAYF